MAKYKLLCLDARGVLAYGLIHCSGSVEDKKYALKTILKLIQDNIKNSGSKNINTSTMLQSIVWLATEGELALNDSFD